MKTPPRTVVLDPSPVLILPKAEFSRLDDRQRRRAFTVTGVANVEVLEEIFDLVMAAAEKGIGWFLEELPKVYDRHGLRATSEAHARRIYDTTLRQLQAEGAYRRTVGNPATWRLTPYLGWAAMLGSSCASDPSSPHALLDGRVFGTGHRIWRTWWYPAGPDCECRVRTLSAREAERAELRGEEPTGPWPIDPRTSSPALPDPGFRSAPLPWDPHEWEG